MTRAPDQPKATQWIEPYRYVLGPGRREIDVPEDKAVDQYLQEALAGARGYSLEPNVFSASAAAVRWMLNEQEPTRTAPMTTSDGEKATPTVDDTDLAILRAMDTRPTYCWTNDKIDAKTGAMGNRVADRTISQRMPQLEKQRFVDRNPPRKGRVITELGQSEVKRHDQAERDHVDDQSPTERKKARSVQH